MIFTVHAGHAAPGKKYVGASGYVSESEEDRKIKDCLINALRSKGHSVYDCTVDTGTSASNIITKIKSGINSHSPSDFNISIHLNACTLSGSDGKTKGTESLVYSATGTAADMGKKIASSISSLGFTNRGVKVRTDLGVLKGIKNGGANILVETFFCDDQDDVNLYKKVGAQGIANAIASALTGDSVHTVATATASISYYPKYTGSSASLVDALKAVGVGDTSLTHRKKIASANHILGYTGTSAQNNKLLSLLKSGVLIKE